MKVETRDEWKIDYAGVEVSAFYPFGWKFHQHLLPVGGKYVMFAERDYTVDELPNRSMFVKGRATAQHSDGTQYEDRLPGHYSQDRPTQPAGLLTTTAVEPTEMWCVNYLANKGALPGLTPIVLAAGEEHTFLEGQFVFIMSGTSEDLVGPQAFVPDEDLTLTADTPLYAYVIDGFGPFNENGRLRD